MRLSGILFNVLAAMPLYLGFAMPAFHASASEPAPGMPSGYDRPGPNPHQSRSVLMAGRGIVATSEPMAALAGLFFAAYWERDLALSRAPRCRIPLVFPLLHLVGGLRRCDCRDE